MLSTEEIIDMMGVIYTLNTPIIWSEFEAAFWTRGAHKYGFRDLLDPKFVEWEDPNIEWAISPTAFYITAKPKTTPTMKSWFVEYLRPFLLEYLREGPIKEAYKKSVAEMAMMGEEYEVKEL